MAVTQNALPRPLRRLQWLPVAPRVSDRQSCEFSGSEVVVDRNVARWAGGSVAPPRPQISPIWSPRCCHRQPNRILVVPCNGSTHAVVAPLPWGWMQQCALGCDASVEMLLASHLLRSFHRRDSPPEPAEEQHFFSWHKWEKMYAVGVNIVDSSRQPSMSCE